MDNAAADGLGGRLRAVVDAQFLQHAAYVELHGDFGDAQRRGDLPVAAAQHDQVEHVHFAAGQFRPALPGRELGGNGRREIGLAGMNRADGRQELGCSTDFGRYAATPTRTARNTSSSPS